MVCWSCCDGGSLVCCWCSGCVLTVFRRLAAFMVQWRVGSLVVCWWCVGGVLVVCWWCAGSVCWWCVLLVCVGGVVVVCWWCCDGGVGCVVMVVL